MDRGKYIKRGYGKITLLLNDSVGCWFGNKYVISSEFKWLAHMVSSSRLWLNKVDTSESANDYTLACMRALYNFYNSHGNVVRNLLVADIKRVSVKFHLLYSHMQIMWPA